MKRFSRALCVLLTALLLLSGGMLLSSRVWAADYADGTYTVPFSMEGLGRHNVAWSSATVHVEGGALYVDFTVERVDPRDHAPQYDWIRTSLGTVTPVLNDENYTCSFYRVPVANLGRVDVTVQSSGMSQPYEIDYTLVIDGSSIPAAAAPEPSAEPTPEPTSTEPAPMPSAEPTPDPTPVPSAEPSPEPSAEPTSVPSTEPSPATAPEGTAAPEEPKPPASSEPLVTQSIPAIGAAEPTQAGSPVGGTVIAIAAAVVVIAAAAVLAVRAKKKK